MRYQLKKEAGLPAYLQLYYLLRDDIVAGVFRANEKLPSKRVLADETGVSTITVEHAYALLSDEGYIEPRERSGYFVVFNAGDGYFAPQPVSVTYERRAAEPFRARAAKVRFDAQGNRRVYLKIIAGTLSAREEIRLCTAFFIPT